MLRAGWPQSGPGQAASWTTELGDPPGAEGGQSVRWREVGEPRVHPLDTLVGQPAEMVDELGGRAGHRGGYSAEAPGRFGGDRVAVGAAADVGHQLLDRHPCV